MNKLDRPVAEGPGGVRALGRMWALSFACLVPMISVSWLVLYWGRQHTDRPFTLIEAGLLLADWSLWAAIAPLIVLFVWRFPVRGPGTGRRLAMHLAAGAAVALGELALYTAVARAINGAGRPFLDSYWSIATLWYPYALLVYCIIAIAAHAIAETRRARQREIEAASLSEQLTAAQLQALRMQLHPHFLCNTLNTVTVLLREGRTRDAEEIVTLLGGLLHTALAGRDTQEVPLGEELGFVSRYLEIERRRYADRMEVAVDADPAVMGALVPWMILQPIAENAVRHGIARRLEAGRIQIEAGRSNGELRVVVRDDGPGFGGRTTTPGHGVGLENARQRLERLYGKEGSLTIIDTGEAGATVEIRVPFHTSKVANPDGVGISPDCGAGEPR